LVSVCFAEESGDLNRRIDVSAILSVDVANILSSCADMPPCPAALAPAADVVRAGSIVTFPIEVSIATSDELLPTGQSQPVDLPSRKFAL
jgi:hypothetical protein